MTYSPKTSNPLVQAWREDTVHVTKHASPTIGPISASEAGLYSELPTQECNHGLEAIAGADAEDLLSERRGGANWVKADCDWFLFFRVLAIQVDKM